MPRKQADSLLFPFGGVVRSTAYQHQPPYTAFDALNVRPRDTFERRLRGGSRPGEIKTSTDQLGSGNPIRLLEVLRTSQEPQTVTIEDQFATTIGSVWDGVWNVTADRFSGPWAVPTIDSGNAITVGGSGAKYNSLILDATSYNADADISTEADLYIEGASNPFNGTADASAGARLMVALGLSANVGTGAEFDAAVVVFLNVQSNGTIWVSVENQGSLLLETTKVPTTTTGKTLRLVLSGSTLSIYCGSRTNLFKTVTGVSVTGTRIAIASLRLSSVSRDFGYHFFKFNYEPTGITTIATEALIAVSNGALNRETTTGNISALSTTVSLASDRQLMGAGRLAKLYIADNSAKKASGTDGTLSGTTFDSGTYTDWSVLSIDTEEDLIEIIDGTVTSPATTLSLGTYRISSLNGGTHLTLAAAPVSGGGCSPCAATSVSFRILRGPKVYNSVTDSLALWNPTIGKIPLGCTIICRYRDRIVLAGDPDNATVWYMSRLSDPDDWLFVSNDSGSAVAATDAVDAGQLGFPISAVAPIGDDFLIVSAKTEMALLRGDPLFGGVFNVISRTIGVLDRFAWTLTGENVFVFLSRAGLYQYVPGSAPEPLSLQLPQELKTIDTGLFEIILRYDVDFEGVHIFITPKSAGAGQHWWFDWTTKTLWPVQYPSNIEPLTCTYHAGRNRVIMGCRDGYLRQHEDYADDDGTAIYSSVQLGPISLGSDLQDGMLQMLNFTLDDNSGDVDWAASVGRTSESATSEAASVSGTLTSGFSGSHYPRARGRAFTLSLSSTERWALDGMAMQRLVLGKRRP